MDKAIQYAKSLKAGLDFFEFESAIINKFGDQADGFDIQDLYISYYL